MSLHDRLVPHHTHPAHRKRLNMLAVALTVNVALAFMWGAVFIGLTALGPARALSSQVIWVAVISYYANAMANLATAAGLYSALVAHKTNR